MVAVDDDETVGELVDTEDAEEEDIVAVEVLVTLLLDVVPVSAELIVDEEATVVVLVAAPADPELVTWKLSVRTCPHSSPTATVYVPGANAVARTGLPYDPIIGMSIGCSCERPVRFQ